MKSPLLLLMSAVLAACGGPLDETADFQTPDEAPTSVAQAIKNCPAGEICEPADPENADCSTSNAAAPLNTVSYGCDLTLIDRLGRPAVGQTVTMRASWCNRSGVQTQGSISALTGADGRAVLTLSTRAANVLNCAVATLDGIDTTRNIRQLAALTTGTRISFNATKYPTPNATRFLPGLVAGNGQMDLYQSGNYDKVVIIPEYFDLKENDDVRRRTRNKFFTETKTLVQELYNRGYDVWLFQPSSTGANLHEQSAEFAQAIDVATRTFAVPQCVAHKVGIVGLNTAGVVARIATARWEADAAWRNSLGIPTAALPVAFLASVDAPQYGLHLNIDLQKFIHEEIGGADIHNLYNLDSCAMQQLLRLTRTPGGSVSSSAFRSFMVDGTPTVFYSKFTGGNVTCAAGPAVSSLNAARGVPGWPTAPKRFGISFGSSGHNNQCYGDNRDLNGSGDNICKFASDFTSNSIFTPSVGNSWLKFVVNNWFDRYADARAEDLVPGSRSPFYIDGMLRDGFFDVTARQRFSPTFIPLVSARGSQGPVGSNLFGTIASPFSDANWFENLYSGVSDAAPVWPMIALVNTLTTDLVCSVKEGTVIVNPFPGGGVLQR